jgi:hypothetical protein
MYFQFLIKEHDFLKNFFLDVVYQIFVEVSDQNEQFELHNFFYKLNHHYLQINCITNMLNNSIN